MLTIAELRSTVPQTGTVRRILLRPARRDPARDVTAVAAVAGSGLTGDRAGPGRRRPSPRQVTLVQAEHLPVVAALLGRDEPIDAALLRRNIVVAGIPVLALGGLRIQVGDAVLVGTGPCHPCSRMEEALGPGGYQAMRGHGGLTATVEQGGTIEVGATVVALGPASDAVAAVGEP